MAEIAHSIPAPGLHRFEGASQPGAGRPTFRSTSPSRPAPRPRPQTRPRNSSNPDADLIDLARRVKALAERDHRAHERLADLTDVMHREVGFLPRRPTPPIGLEYKTEVVGDLHMTILTRPLETPERDAILAAHEIAVADHGRREREVEQRLGLPALDKRVTRMARRLVRWSKRLTAMEPRTPAGLKAKAEAQIAIDRGGSLDEWTQELASSVGRDAVRIATALADVPPAGDAELLDLIARHGSAMAEWDEASEAQEPVGEAWRKAVPPRPQALYWNAGDRRRASLREKVPDREAHLLVYGEADIDKMRAKPVFSIVEHREPAHWDPNDTIVRRERVPDEAGEARRIQIIEAWDGWQAAIERLRETTGLNAANAAFEAVAERVYAIEDAILDYQPSTFEGLQAKARWISSTPFAEERAETLLRDLCRMPPIALAPPAQVMPSRDVVESYRAFLDMELRFLNHECGYEGMAARSFWLDNPAGSFHAEAPPPSTRAVAVLAAFGLMPGYATENERTAEARAA